MNLFGNIFSASFLGLSDGSGYRVATSLSLYLDWDMNEYPYTIELTVHATCYCVLDFVCVTKKNQFYLSLIFCQFESSSFPLFCLCHLLSSWLLCKQQLLNFISLTCHDLTVEQRCFWDKDSFAIVKINQKVCTKKWLF